MSTVPTAPVAELLEQLLDGIDVLETYPGGLAALTAAVEAAPTVTESGGVITFTTP